MDIFFAFSVQYTRKDETLRLTENEKTVYEWIASKFEIPEVLN